MVRYPYLASVAWGRSAWAPPEENDWDPVTQTAIPTVTRTGMQLTGQYTEDVQQYDESLRPVNPGAQTRARERRIAANNILSIIGVVDKTHHEENSHERNSEKQAKETPYLIPVFFMTRSALMITSQWIINITSRLLAFPTYRDVSMSETIIEDYTVLGSTSFFFAGIPATLAEFFVRPSWLAPMSAYWTFRAILAKVPSLETRNYLLSISTTIYKAYWVLFEVLDFPFRLNMTLQQLGLVHPFKFVPGSEIFSAIIGTSWHTIPLPLLCVFFYGPFAHLLNKHIVKPRVVPVVDWMFHTLEDPTRPLTPATTQPGLRGSTRRQRTPRRQTPQSNAVNLAANSSSLTGPSSSALQPGSITVQRNASTRPASILNFVDESPTTEEHNQGYSPQSPSHQHAGSSTTPPGAAGAQRGSPVELEHPIDEGEMFHQIRISGHENAEGALIEELNISFYDRITDTNPGDVAQYAGEGQPPRLCRRSDLPLSDTPQRIAEALLTAHITSILLQPLDSWLLPRLARWWITTQGGTDTLGFSTQILATSSIVVAPFFSKKHFRSVLSKASKLLLCIAIREVIIVGVWVVQTKGVIWLGRTKLGWSEAKNKRLRNQ